MEGIKSHAVEVETSDLEAEIPNVQNWEQLYSVIENAKVIKGTHERNSFDVLSDLDSVRRECDKWTTDALESKDLINSSIFLPFTRSFGLREKVVELLVKERKQRNKELVNNILDNENIVRDRVLLLKLLDDMNGIK